MTTLYLKPKDKPFEPSENENNDIAIHMVASQLSETLQKKLKKEQSANEQNTVENLIKKFLEKFVSETGLRLEKKIIQDDPLLKEFFSRSLATIFEEIVANNPLEQLEILLVGAETNYKKLLTGNSQTILNEFVAQITEHDDKINSEHKSQSISTIDMLKPENKGYIPPSELFKPADIDLALQGYLGSHGAPSITVLNDKVLINTADPSATSPDLVTLKNSITDARDNVIAKNPARTILLPVHNGRSHFVFMKIEIKPPAGQVAINITDSKAANAVSEEHKNNNTQIMKNLYETLTTLPGLTFERPLENNPVIYTGVQGQDANCPFYAIREIVKEFHREEKANSNLIQPSDNLSAACTDKIADFQSAMIKKIARLRFPDSKDQGWINSLEVSNGVVHRPGALKYEEYLRTQAEIKNQPVYDNKGEVISSVAFIPPPSPPAPKMEVKTEISSSPSLTASIGAPFMTPSNPATTPESTPTTESKSAPTASSTSFSAASTTTATTSGATTTTTTTTSSSSTTTPASSTTAPAATSTAAPVAKTPKQQANIDVTKLIKSIIERNKKFQDKMSEFEDNFNEKQIAQQKNPILKALAKSYAEAIHALFTSYSDSFVEIKNTNDFYRNRDNVIKNFEDGLKDNERYIAHKSLAEKEKWAADFISNNISFTKDNKKAINDAYKEPHKHLKETLQDIDKLILKIEELKTHSNPAEQGTLNPQLARLKVCRDGIQKQLSNIDNTIPVSWVYIGIANDLASKYEHDNLTRSAKKSILKVAMSLINDPPLPYTQIIQELEKLQSSHSIKIEHYIDKILGVEKEKIENEIKSIKRSINQTPPTDSKLLEELNFTLLRRNIALELFNETNIAPPLTKSESISFANRLCNNAEAISPNDILNFLNKTTKRGEQVLNAGITPPSPYQKLHQNVKELTLVYLHNQKVAVSNEITSECKTPGYRQENFAGQMLRYLQTLKAEWSAIELAYSLTEAEKEYQQTRIKLISDAMDAIEHFKDSKDLFYVYDIAARLQNDLSKYSGVTVDTKLQKYLTQAARTISRLISISNPAFNLSDYDQTYLFQPVKNQYSATSLTQAQDKKSAISNELKEEKEFKRLIEERKKQKKEYKSYEDVEKAAHVDEKSNAYAYLIKKRTKYEQDTKEFTEKVDTRRNQIENKTAFTAPPKVSSPDDFKTLISTPVSAVLINLLRSIQNEWAAQELAEGIASNIQTKARNDAVETAISKINLLSPVDLAALSKSLSELQDTLENLSKPSLSQRLNPLGGIEKAQRNALNTGTHQACETIREQIDHLNDMSETLDSLITDEKKSDNAHADYESKKEAKRPSKYFIKKSQDFMESFEKASGKTHPLFMGRHIGRVEVKDNKQTRSSVLDTTWHYTAITSPATSSNLAANVPECAGLPTGKENEYQYEAKDQANGAHIRESNKNGYLQISVPKEPDNYKTMDAKQQFNADLIIADAMVRLWVERCGNSEKVPVSISDAENNSRLAALIIVCKAHNLKFTVPMASEFKANYFIPDTNLLNNDYNLADIEAHLRLKGPIKMKPLDPEYIKELKMELKAITMDYSPAELKELKGNVGYNDDDYKIAKDLHTKLESDKTAPKYIEYKAKVDSLTKLITDAENGIFNLDEIKQINRELKASREAVKSEAESPRRRP